MAGDVDPAIIRVGACPIDGPLWRFQLAVIACCPVVFGAAQGFVVDVVSRWELPDGVSTDVEGRVEGVSCVCLGGMGRCGDDGAAGSGTAWGKGADPGRGLATGGSGDDFQFDSTPSS